MKIQIVSTSLKSSFLLTLQLSTALMTFFTATQGWAMEAKEQVEGSLPLSRQRAIPNEKKFNDMSVEERILALLPENMRNSPALKVERDKFISIMTPMLNGVLYDYYDVIYPIEHIPQGERAEFMKIIRPLFKYIPDNRPRGCGVIISSVGRFPRGELAEYLEYVTPFLEGITDYRECTSLIFLTAKTMQGKRARFLKMAKPFLVIIPPSMRMRELSAFCDLLEDESVDDLERVIPFFERVKDVKKLRSIICKIKYRPASEKDDVLRLMMERHSEKG